VVDELVVKHACAILFVASACSSDEHAIHDAQRVSTYVAVSVVQGVDDLDGAAEWRASAEGYSGDARWQPNGPDPTPGTCIFWRLASYGNPIGLPQNPTLNVDGVGSFPMIMFADGEIDLVGGPAALRCRRTRRSSPR
jgi:hypothetical protein